MRGPIGKQVEGSIGETIEGPIGRGTGTEPVKKDKIDFVNVDSNLRHSGMESSVIPLQYTVTLRPKNCKADYLALCNMARQC